ncbi:MAG: tetratricopeptide repeat protein [Oligoflexia bacterium]|nr:tetratricopeptide repeat protein [Oligoflexia bacterium]
MKIKALLLFSVTLLLLSQAAQSQMVLEKGISLYSIEYFWKEAIELYVTETEDYLDTMSTSSLEFKQWRLRVLQDKFETRISGLETVLSKSNFSELAQLEKSVQERGLDSLDDSLMMRLAQLHYDRAVFDFNIKSKNHRGKNAKNISLISPDYKKTIFYTREIIKRFPKSSVLEHAYYLLGFCLFDENKDSPAAKTYEQMLKTFPLHPLSFEARWRLAEYYFEQNQFELAKQNYDYLIKHPNSFSQKAVYKLGAVYYSQQKYSNAYKIFIELYNQTLDRLGTDDPEAETLNSEALDYLAHLKTKDIPMNVDDELESNIVLRLSEIYHQKLNDAESRNVLVSYSKQKPYTKFSPVFLNSVIDSLEYDNLYSAAQKIREMFLNTYKPNSPFWVRWEKDVSTTVEIQDLYESVLLSSAHYYADLARRTNKFVSYQKAIEHYNKFIEEHPISPLKNQARFEMADLQYFAADYSDAGATYMNMTIDTDSDEYKEEAAYGYFLSEMKRIKYDPALNSNFAADFDKNGRLNPVSDFSQKEKQFFEAADFYTKNVPKGFRRQKILYKKAELFFKHNRFKDARAQLEDILKEQELSSIATKALRMLSETYNLEGNWSKIVEIQKMHFDVTRRLSFDITQTDELFKSKAPLIRQALKSEKRGEAKDAAELYEFYSIKYSKSSETPASLLKSGLIYKNLGQIPDSERVLNRLVNDYPKSRYKPAAEFLLASNFEGYLMFEEAIKKFDKIFKKYPKKEIGLQALISMASIQYALMQYDEAAEKYKTYAQVLKDDYALLTAAEIYRKAGNKKAALKVYTQLSKEHKGKSLAVEAYLNLAEMASTNEQKAEYCRVIKSFTKNTQLATIATTQHALTGCMYFKVRPYAQKVSKEKLVKHWPNLSQVYDAIIQAQDYQWLKEVAADLEKLVNRTGFAPARLKLEEIQLKLAENKIEQIDTTQARLSGVDAETLQVRWPIESSLVRVAFDQKKWEELIKNARTELSLNKNQPYLYVAISRAYAEKSFWVDASSTLKECVQETKDGVCSAYLSFIEPKYGFEDLNYDPDDEAIIHLAKAVKLAKTRKNPEEQFKKAVKSMPQLPDTYKYFSKYLNAKKKYDLAKLVLDAGIRNTQGDDRLLVEKGMLALEQKDKDLAQAVVNEMRYYDAISNNSFLYRAIYYYIDNNPTQAQAFLKQIDAQDSPIYKYASNLIYKNMDRIPAGEKK